MRNGNGNGGRYRNNRGGGGGGRRGGGHHRGGGRGGGHHRGGGGGRGRFSRGRPQHRDPRQAAEGGNRRERISIESGHLVLIDQFMLANPQFIARVNEVVDEDPTRKDEIIREFGGIVIALEPGTYRIDRDPFAYLIIVHHEDDKLDDAQSAAEEANEDCGEVYIDTRCLAMIDRELLDDSGLLEKYGQLWFGGQDKACRDLLRDNGGAVRYGFQRYGDELQVRVIPGRDVVCLSPNAAVGIQAGGEAAAAS